MITATLILGGDAVRQYNTTGQIPSPEWLMDNGGVVKDIEFPTKAEYAAYIQGVSDAHLWVDYRVIPKTAEESQPKQAIWMRVGTTVKGSTEEIEKIIEGDDETLCRLLETRNFDIDGETYIPSTVVEEYNRENNTDFEEKDVDFYSINVSMN